MFTTWPQARGAALALALASTVALGGCRGDRGSTDRTDRVADRAAERTDQAGDKLSEAWVTTKIKAKYFGDEAVKGRNIDVDTRNGVVTLLGQVENEQARQRAVQIARDTDGVTRVDDRLSVVSSGGAIATSGSEAGGERPAGSFTGSATASAHGPGADQDILAQIQSQFFRRQPLRHSEVDVAASGGVVTLTGEVDSESLHQEALSIAQAAPGVKRVEDLIQLSPSAAPAGTGGEITPVPPAPVTPPAPAAPDAPPPSPAGMSTDEWIATQIQSRYFEDVLVKNAAIRVSASGGTVTLEGIVPNDAARQQAVRIANETAGVSRVDDQLTIR